MSTSQPRPDPPLRRAEALADGMTDVELARLVRRGELTRLQRGTYLHDATPPTGPARHAAIVAATLAGLRVPGVVSHDSAAVLHGLPIWNVPLSRVHATRPASASGSGSRRVHQPVGRLPDDEVIALKGLAVTDLARTAVDVTPLWRPRRRRGSTSSTAWRGWVQCPASAAPPVSSPSPTDAVRASGRAAVACS